MILMFWNKFINNYYCDFAWIFRISRLCFQKSVPRFSLHKFLGLNWQFWKSFSTSTSWQKIGQAYLEREQSRFFRLGGGALGRDDETSQSSDDVEDLDVDMGRPGVPTGHRFENALMLLIILYLSKNYQLWLLHIERDYGYISRFQKNQ